MKVTLTYTSVLRNHIPPRARKPRDVFTPGQEYEVDIPEVSAADAPIAMLIRDPYHERVQELRWWDGRLWTNWSYDRPREKPALVENGKWPIYDTDQRVVDDIDETAAAFVAKYVIIDGEVWTERAEPILEVKTAGFERYVYLTVEHLYKDMTFPDDGDTRLLFRADQFEQARDVAIVLAKRDSSRVEALRAERPAVEVLIPEAVQANIPPTFEVRVEWTESAVLRVVAPNERAARRIAREKVDDGRVRDQRRNWYHIDLVRRRVTGAGPANLTRDDM